MAEPEPVVDAPAPVVSEPVVTTPAPEPEAKPASAPVAEGAPKQAPPMPPEIDPDELRITANQALDGDPFACSRGGS